LIASIFTNCKLTFTNSSELYYIHKHPWEVINSCCVGNQSSMDEIWRGLLERLHFSFLIAFCLWLFHSSSLLGAFKKLRETTVSFVISVRPHETNQLPLDGFSWNLIFGYCFENIENTQVSLNFDKNIGHFTRTQIHIMIISCSVILRMRNVLDEFVEKIQKTHFMFNKYFRKSRHL